MLHRIRFGFAHAAVAHVSRVLDARLPVQQADRLDGMRVAAIDFVLKIDDPTMTLSWTISFQGKHQLRHGLAWVMLMRPASKLALTRHRRLHRPRPQSRSLLARLACASPALRFRFLRLAPSRLSTALSCIGGRPVMLLPASKTSPAARQHRHPVEQSCALQLPFEAPRTAFHVWRRRDLASGPRECAGRVGVQCARAPHLHEAVCLRCPRPWFLVSSSSAPWSLSSLGYTSARRA